ncbi:caffeoyl-CoA O-methyltransferase [Lentzea waywayandensis]|uniref:Caffeoyl-CoA O-methyltransferase n=1 Tax=Lentzea waywayandensis TaxID=84724 RepID=A0A1I6FJN7_9PSEU|nr:O-methyltransferase [Lentzea waywayandensis]SFR30156.1 caffeoyl-CoA O-methyltransferase [Lentzea waywayandensis]
MLNDFKNIVMTNRLYDYMLAQAEPPTPAQRELIERTHALGTSAEMQIPHEQAVLLTILVQITGARNVVEIGTYTGYSTLALSRGLGPEGWVLTCDVSEEWTAIAEQVWRDAGVADRIRLELGPAADTLRALPDTADIDLVFIDADKAGYIEYWELLVPRVRSGGLLLVDNVLYYGEVVQESPSPNGKAIDMFNEHVRADDRVESVLLPIADGLTLARKR